jgi:hypothetical protein
MAGTPNLILQMLILYVLWLSIWIRNEAIQNRSGLEDVSGSRRVHASGGSVFHFAPAKRGIAVGAL